MPMDIILHFAAEERTETINDVTHFETEWGDTNSVYIEQADGSSRRWSGRGLTVSGGTETR